MAIVLLTEERPEPEMAIRLALLVLDLPLWNSEEDLAEARRTKFIMSMFKIKHMISSCIKIQTFIEI